MHTIYKSIQTESFNCTLGTMTNQKYKIAKGKQKNVTGHDNLSSTLHPAPASSIRSDMDRKHGLGQLGLIKH